MAKRKNAARRAAPSKLDRGRASVASRADAGGLFRRVVKILDGARAATVRAVDNQMVLAYWLTGREILQYLQGGEERAPYGQRLIEDLSQRLTERYGRGFSASNLRYFRQFFQAFTDREPEIRHLRIGESRRIHQSRIGESRGARPVADVVTQAMAMAAKEPGPGAGFAAELGWGHYRVLMVIESRAERRFYEIEAAKAAWSVEHLERQVHTFLFARLLKSRDRAGVMELVQQGQEMKKPVDALKDPYVLDFLDIPDGGRIRESDLEAAIIAQLQAFLLELGKGFAFVARQRRLAFEDEHFYVDLVFYNTILKFYLLIDLKIGKLTHQDIGQMDGYVRLFDDQFTTDGDNPTVGLILCAEKNEAVARYSVLNGSRQVFAAKYLQYLPSEEQLRREIEREQKMLEVRRPTKRGR